MPMSPRSAVGGSMIHRLLTGTERLCPAAMICLESMFWVMFQLSPWQRYEITLNIKL